jgi:hypothetical protein
MENFHALRVAHHFTQTNHAPLNEVFPLLCPVREAEWVPGWSYRLIFSNSCFAEEGCVFATPNDDGVETIWTITDYDARNFRIAFVWEAAINHYLKTGQIISTNNSHRS